MSGCNPNATRHLMDRFRPSTGAAPEVTTLITLTDQYSSSMTALPHPYRGENPALVPVESALFDQCRAPTVKIFSLPAVQPFTPVAAMNRLVVDPGGYTRNPSPVAGLHVAWSNASAWT